MADKSDYMDGLLEGHESNAVKWVNRLGLIAFSILSGFSMIIDFAMAALKGGSIASPFVGIGILGLAGLVFLQVSWHRRDQMAKKHRFATIYLMFIVVILDVATCIEFHRVLSYKEPTCAPTAAPTTTSTSAPPVTTNTSDWFY